jgi:hypothetical protein
MAALSAPLAANPRVARTPFCDSILSRARHIQSLRAPDPICKTGLMMLRENSEERPQAHSEAVALNRPSVKEFP